MLTKVETKFYLAVKNAMKNFNSNVLQDDNY